MTDFERWIDEHKKLDNKDFYFIDIELLKGYIDGKALVDADVILATLEFIRKNPHYEKSDLELQKQLRECLK